LSKGSSQFGEGGGAWGGRWGGPGWSQAGPMSRVARAPAAAAVPRSDRLGIRMARLPDRGGGDCEQDTPWGGKRRGEPRPRGVRRVRPRSGWRRGRLAGPEGVWVRDRSGRPRPPHGAPPWAFRARSRSAGSSFWFPGRADDPDRLRVPIPQGGRDAPGPLRVDRPRLLPRPRRRWRQGAACRRGRWRGPSTSGSVTSCASPAGSRRSVWSWGFLRAPRGMRQPPVA